MQFNSPITPTHSARKQAALRNSLLIATAFGLFGNLTKKTEAATVPSQTLTLAWDAPPETKLQGYKIYVGMQSLQYPVSYVVGNQLTYQVTGLTSGQTYYFAVTAIGSNGIESYYSAEVVSKIPSPPVSLADTYTTNQGVALIVPATGVLNNDSDPQSLPLTAILDAPPSNGALILNTDGSFLYTPVATYIGTDSFTYHANNGRLDSNLVAVNLTMSPVVSAILANGSFETEFTGWTKTGNITTQSALPYKPTAGSKLVAFNNANLNANGVLSQTFTTVVGTTYNLTFDLGVLSYNTSAQKMLVTVAGKKTVLSKTLNLTGTGGGACVWTNQNFTFVADRTTSTLSFRDQSTATIGLDLLLDRVQVTDSKLSGTLASSSSLTTTSNPSLATTSNTSLQSQSTPTTVLATPEITASAGALTTRVVATEVGTYVLERSNDLITWTGVSELKVSTPGPIEFPADPSPKTSGSVFYRVGFQPN